MKEYAEVIKKALLSGSSWIGLILTIALIFVFAIIIGVAAAGLGVSVASSTKSIVLTIITVILIVIVLFALVSPIVMSPLYRGIYKAIGGSVEGYFNLKNYFSKAISIFIVTLIEVGLAIVLVVLPVMLLAPSLTHEISYSKYSYSNVELMKATKISSTVALFKILTASYTLLAIIIIALIVLTWIGIGVNGAIHGIINKDYNVSEALNSFIKIITNKQTVFPWLIYLGTSIILGLASVNSVLEFILSIIFVIIQYSVIIYHADKVMG